MDVCYTIDKKKAKYVKKHAKKLTRRYEAKKAELIVSRCLVFASIPVGFLILFFVVGTSPIMEDWFIELFEIVFTLLLFIIPSLIATGIILWIKNNKYVSIIKNKKDETISLLDEKLDYQFSLPEKDMEGGWYNYIINYKDIKKITFSPIAHKIVITGKHELHRANYHYRDNPWASRREDDKEFTIPIYITSANDFVQELSKRAGIKFDVDLNRNLSQQYYE